MASRMWIKSKDTENVVIDHRYESPKDKPEQPRRKFFTEIQWGKYNDLPLPADKILATYIWVDETGENLRSKDRTLDLIRKVPTDKLTLALEAYNNKILEDATKQIKCSHYNKYLPPHSWPRDLEKIDKVPCKLRNYGNTGFFDENLKDLPIWHYDSASTGQATVHDSEIYLFPRAIYKDPFRYGNHILVLCDTYYYNFEPTETNHRKKCLEAYEKCKEFEPWFGIEQEYFLLRCSDLWPLGWPPGGGFPPPENRYHYATGADRVFARDLILAHYRCCAFAGIPISGTNPELAPSQWEYQVGPSVGVNAGDDLWVSRYILNRLAEEYGVVITMDPKPIPNWSGSGAHTNFSTKKMREDNGIIEIEKAIFKLSRVHNKHLRVYDPHGGKDNLKRFVPFFQAPHGNKFTAGVAERSNCVRIPPLVHQTTKGFFEDRRPASNCDPYCVVNALLSTCILDQ